MRYQQAYQHGDGSSWDAVGQFDVGASLRFLLSSSLLLRGFFRSAGRRGSTRFAPDRLSSGLLWRMHFDTSEFTAFFITERQRERSVVTPLGAPPIVPSLHL